jgi:hypothetical protein
MRRRGHFGARGATPLRPIAAIHATAERRERPECSTVPYRNDAAIVMTSDPFAADGVRMDATCDKGLHDDAALAGCSSLPGSTCSGVTLPAMDAEDAGQVQSLGARFAHDLISLDYAAEMGCRACGSSYMDVSFERRPPQVVAEALGLRFPQRVGAVRRAGLD